MARHGRTTAATGFGHAEVPSMVAAGPPLRVAFGERGGGTRAVISSGAGPQSYEGSRRAEMRGGLVCQGRHGVDPYEGWGVDEA